MAQIYAWRPRGLSDESARAAFVRALERQAGADLATTGRAQSTAVAAVGGAGPDGASGTADGRVLVGWLGPEDGVRGWRAWDPDRGLAWTGIREDRLDAVVGAGPTVVDNGPALAARIAASDPGLLDAAGRFGVVAWDDAIGAATIAGGPVGSPSLWWTDGPRGIAAGSRANVLLELVGRPASLDLDRATLFVALGYLIGDGALFEGVNRLPAGQALFLGGQAAGGPGRGPGRPFAYAPPEAVLHGAPTSLRDPVLAAAAIVGARVAHQLAHSPDPVVLLTGGRDSRQIAAAAARAGFRGPARTGERGNQAVVAARVAAALGLSHDAGPDARPLGPSAGGPALGADPRRPTRHLVTPEAAATWLQATEGLASLELSLSSRAYYEFGPFEGPRPAAAGQLFHGLTGETSRGYFYPPVGRLGRPGGPATGRRALGRKIPPEVRFRRPIGDLVAGVADEVDRELRPTDPTAAQWLDGLYWRRRVLQWGEDLLSVSDRAAWHWTPLLDRDLLRIGWHLPARDKAGDRFVEAVTLELAPALASVGYERPTGPVRRAARELAKDALHALGRIDPRLADPRRARRRPDPILGALWTTLFFEAADPVWPLLVDAATLRRLVALDPSAHVLWNLATVEAFARAHLGSAG